MTDPRSIPHLVIQRSCIGLIVIAVIISSSSMRRIDPDRLDRAEIIAHPYTASMPTIFDKIIAGEIPCHKVYEDDHVLAFLDIGPLAEGHTLVVPKEAKAHLHELSDESAAAIGRVLPRLCRAVLSATGATAYNILQNNGAEAHQAVMHVHFHIIPRRGSEGLGLTWNAGTLQPDRAKTLVAAITSALASS